MFGYLEACRYRYNLRIADIWNGFLTSMEADYLKKVREGLDERELELADLCADGVTVWRTIQPNARRPMSTPWRI